MTNAELWRRPTNAELLTLAMIAAGDPGPIEAVSDPERMADSGGNDPEGLHAWTPTRVWFGEEYLRGEPYGPRWTYVPRHPGGPSE